MLKKIGWLLLIAVAGVLALAWSRPDTFSVERRAIIQAPPEKIQPLIIDFHRWAEWSPWEKLDPQMQRDFGGAPAGVGATYAWQGNKDVGRGRMEVLSVTPERIGIQLDFLEPIEAHNRTDFILTPQASGGTELRWVMTGPANLMSKLMDLAIGMDRMVGPDFEKGLAQMKAVAER